MSQITTTMPDVHLINNIPQTTSLNISAVFQRPHKDVLNSIKQLSCSIEFNRRNFSPVKYTDKKGESRPMYEMTRDGFFFLVMGFTGAKAAAFKEAYIEAFNQMESDLYKHDDKTHDTAIMAECNQKMAEVESHYKSQMIAQQQQLIQMTSEAYQLAKEHIIMLKRASTGSATNVQRRVSITYDMDTTRPDRFVKQVINALKLFPNLNKTQLLGECGYNKDDKTARKWLDAFEGEHWFCRKRSGVFTYNLSADELQGDAAVQGEQS